MQDTNNKILNVPPPEATFLFWRGRKAFEAPIKAFLAREASGGVLLLVAAVVAMIWVNLDHHSYEALWHTEIRLGVNGDIDAHSLHFWINEGLMSLFFFVVGLEIKREMAEGELSNVRRASLPVAAALGGMVLPMLLYLALNHTGETVRGTPIPAATDIAFAVGVLMLLGKRVPPALKVLLMSLAVVDDIGAIVIIALFYSQGFSMIGILIALGGVALFVALRVTGLRVVWLYFLPFFVVWYGFFEAGIHPTLSGVVIGLLVPGNSRFLTKFATKRVKALSEALMKAESVYEQMDTWRELKMLSGEAISPRERLTEGLHPWVALVIMPLFALANAGVFLGGETLNELHMLVGIGIAAGLVIGKPFGVLALSYLSVRLRLGQLPRGVNWKGILLVGFMAGIGFTMSNFTALLSFTESAKLGTAKLFILIGSALSAMLGLLLSRWLLPKRSIAGAAADVVQAERSDDV